MNGFISDLRHAVHVYLKSPGPTLLAIGGLAVAIAAVSALLAMFTDLTLKPHPGFARASELITISQTDGSRYFNLSLEVLEQLEAESSSLAVVAGVLTKPLTLNSEGELKTATAELVTRAFFSGLQPRVRLGRGFQQVDHHADAEPVAVLSHAAWQQHFGGRTDVLAQSITLTGSPEFTAIRPGGPPPPPIEHTKTYRVIGVLAPEALGSFATDVAVWLPYEQSAAYFVGEGALARRVAALRGIARMRPNTPLDAVRLELATRFAGLGPDVGMMPSGKLDVIGGVVRDTPSQRDAQRQVQLLLAGGLLLAVVAASNISLFLLSRAPSRQREFGIRRAVGAPTRRLARQLCTEAGLLVATASACGVIISIWLAALLQETPLLQHAQWLQVTPFDWRVLLSICALTLVLTIAVALAPIWGLRRGDISSVSKLSSARAGFMQRLSGTLQVAIVGIVTAAAIAFGWHLRNLLLKDIGFDATDVVVLTTQPPERGRPFNASPDAVLLRRSQLAGAIGALPGVELVSFGSSVPGKHTMFTARVKHPAQPSEMLDLAMVSADVAYPNLLGMKLLHGNGLDASVPNGILVNEALGRTAWGRANVVGEIIGASNMKIVGVLRDVPYAHPAEEIKPMIYRLATPSSARDMILVRGKVRAAELQQTLQAMIDRGELDLALDEAKPLEEIWSETLSADRVRSVMTALCAALVVLLAALGFYGTQSYLVAAGRREYAIRAALGAGPRALGRLVVARGMLLGLPGLVLAAVLGFLTVAWLRDRFVSTEVSPLVATVAVLTASLALLWFATLGPARRARDTAPAPLLREE